jgi:hypothetical protein
MCGACGSGTDKGPPTSAEERDAAAAHGLEPIECPSCGGDGAGCGNCGGSGRLWHSPSGVTLSDAGLRRLARARLRAAAAGARSKRPK